MTQPTTSTITKKQCRDCRRDLPLQQFYRLARSKDGRGTRCKACTKLRHTPATQPSVPTLGPSAPQPHQWPEAPTPCQALPGGLWLSEKEDHRVRAARLCDECPAWDLCRQLAGAVEPIFGVWAGTDYTIKETA